MAKKVYLIRAGQFLKVGISSDVHRRIEQLQHCCPIPIEFIAYLESDNPRYLEKTIHLGLQDFKTFGEWFDLSESRTAKKYDVSIPFDWWVIYVKNIHWFCLKDASILIEYIISNDLIHSAEFIGWVNHWLQRSAEGDNCEGWSMKDNLGIYEYNVRKTAATNG